jgi:hypothetical protein
MVQGLIFTIKFFYFEWKKHQLCQSKGDWYKWIRNHVFVATETDSYTCDTVLIVFTTKPKLKIKPNIPC